MAFIPVGRFRPHLGMLWGFLPKIEGHICTAVQTIDRALPRQALPDKCWKFKHNKLRPSHANLQCIQLADAGTTAWRVCLAFGTEQVRVTSPTV